MYFVYPSRVLRQLDRALTLFADLEWVKLSKLQHCDNNRIYIADVHDYLSQKWSCPTVVIARANEGLELSQAWRQGALAGWIWEDLPEQPFEVLQLIEAQYKRNQDSRDLPAAAKLQTQLLPNKIDIPEYHISHFFQPSAYLSGDWYDYWWIDDSHVLFYLADVSGHGVTSSLLTSWMAAFHGRANTPKQLIQKLNYMLVNENIEKHITMVAGVLNLDTHTITWCNAGHYPPVIYLAPNAEPEVFSSSSFPLGLTEDLELTESTIHVSPGGRLVISSDGVLEQFPGGLTEQFNQFLQQLSDASFAPPPYVNDDIAMLTIARDAE